MWKPLSQPQPVLPDQLHPLNPVMKCSRLPPHGRQEASAHENKTKTFLITFVNWLASSTWMLLHAPVVPLHPQVYCPRRCSDPGSSLHARPCFMAGLETRCYLQGKGKHPGFLLHQGAAEGMLSFQNPIFFAFWAPLILPEAFPKQKRTDFCKADWLPGE